MDPAKATDVTRSDTIAATFIFILSIGSEWPLCLASRTQPRRMCDVNREAELDRPSRVACDLLGCIFCGIIPSFAIALLAS
jgi:hypothetical protein